MIEEAASLWSGIKKYEEILTRDPQALSFAPLAELYRKAGLFEDALAVAKRGAELYPDFAAGHMALARIFIDKAMKKESTAALESVVRITPENTEAQRLLAAMYTDAGNTAAAERCLAIVQALEPDSVVDNIPAVATLPEQFSQGNTSDSTPNDISLDDFDLPESSETFDEEAIMEADVLDLTDELEEEESSVAVSYNAFSAVPERPSLQATANAAQPTTIPDEELTTTSPVASATIAELYISQGFKDKGVDVYRDLLLADPENAVYRNRIDDLTCESETSSLTIVDTGDASSAFIAAEPDSAPPSQDVVETLEGWLSNIRRVKECR